MADAADPRLIRVPGPLAGGHDWGAAALPAAAGPEAPVGDATALRLPAAAGGSFALGCRDGSLGRLTLPRGIAVDHRRRVYLLDRDGKRVLRFDPARPFAPLPGVGNDGLTAADPRWLFAPTAIAVDRHSLYVADGGGRRVLVFDPDGLALQDVWPFRTPDRPRDVVAAGGRVIVLAPDAVYAAEAGGCPRLMFRRRDSGGAWARAAVDTAGLLYLLVPAWLGAPARLQVFDPARPGTRLAEIDDPGRVRDRFPYPAVYSVPDESASRPVRYVLPAVLARGCGREWPGQLPNRTAEVSLSRVPTAAGKPDGGFVFDGSGNRIDPAMVRPARTALYAVGGRPGPVAENPDRRGVWLSNRLDSKLYRCRWDAAELEFADLPAGTAVTVQTFTADNDNLTPADIAMLPEGAWVDGLTTVGVNRDPAADPGVCTDFLIDGPPGRFLWLRVRFRGDGFGTPALTRVQLRFPRRSYLEHLPAVFSEDDQSRRFLERFLAVFQAEWDPLEERVATAAGLFDPAAVPDSHLDYLAGWFGVTFENGWPAAARRRLLEKLPGIVFAGRHEDGRPGGPRRGTAAALREYVAAVLPTLAGDDDLDPGPFPVVVEGFRERDYRQLGADPLPAADRGGPVAAAAGPAPGLFGPAVVNRFQLGRTSRLGEAELIPAEAPDLDLVAAHAHRFRVVVPAAWVPTPAAEAALRRVIEAEKPAHAAYELELVGPRFQVGVRSTVGVNTVLAGPAPVRLGAGPTPGAVLGSAPTAGPARLGPAARVGAVRL